uniref:Flagellar-assembly chaperone protein n=1 Tax=Edwardsiella tarda TaxID=636 RepID=A0A2S1PMM9_EDWTA|nr:flagellar-assembly chaperone protein [Edwardsiella tarda]
MKTNKYLIALLMIAGNTHATFSLSQSGVVVDAKKGETSVVVKNIGTQPILLFSSEVESETKAISGRSLFMLSPPVAKLNPNESQVIRIFLKDKTIDKEMMARIRFQELTDEGNNSTKTIINAAYNIAAIARPATLTENTKPWELLKLNNKNGHLEILNDSLYVVRMAKTIKINNGGKEYKLDINNGYILPGKSLELKNFNYTTTNAVEINPASTTGSILSTYMIKK